MKEQTIRIIVIGVIAGVVLAIGRDALGIDIDVFMKWYFIGAIVLMICVLLGVVIYTMNYKNKMIKAMALLNEGKATEYVEVVSAMEQKALGKSLKNILRLNLTAGYCDLKEYDKAVEILEKLKSEKLKGDVDLVCRLNTCLCYFYTGRTEEAMQLYNESKVLFVTAKNKGVHVPNIAILDMWAMIENGRKKEARQYLEFAREKWPQMRLEEDYRIIEEQLNK
ncbi:MAG: tetratricopeptide repeat protein [Firmicutes bacterium]|nr:tetratricopeptide repeat protein [Bacillota bacterium]